MEPENELRESSRVWRDDRFDSREKGIAPVKELVVRTRDWSLEREERDEGIEPWKKLLERSKIWSCERLDTAEGR